MANWPARTVPLGSPVTWDDLLHIMAVIDDVITPTGAGSGGGSTVITTSVFDSTIPSNVTLTASTGTGTYASRADHVHALSQAISPVWSGNHQFTNDVLPTTAYVPNLGQLTKKWLSVYAAELWVETLVAQNTIATIGGRILVGPTNILTADLADEAGPSTMVVKYNEMAVNDIVYMEANGAVEWMQVTAGPTGSAGAYSYTVTRSLDGSGSNAWSTGDAVFNTGTTGDGYIDLYSFSGVIVGSTGGPTIAGNVRTGTTYSNIATRWAVGNLKGLYDYGATTYGFAAGDYTAAWVSVDATNGVRIMSGATPKITLSAAGTATFSGTITAAAGSIGGWTIGATFLSSSTVTLDSTGLFIAVGTSDILTGDGVFMNATPARFRAGTVSGGALVKGIYFDGTNLAWTGVNTSLTAAGVFTASSAIVTGTITTSNITATGGTVGGWTLGSTTLTSTGITLTSTGGITVIPTTGYGGGDNGYLRFKREADTAAMAAIWAERDTIDAGVNDTFYVALQNTSSGATISSITLGKIGVSTHGAFFSNGVAYTAGIYPGSGQTSHYLSGTSYGLGIDCAPVATGGTLQVGTIGGASDSIFAVVGSLGICAMDSDSRKTIYLYCDGSVIKLDAYDYAASAALNFTLGGNGGNTSVAGVLLATDGTSAAPGISFSGDTNTGIYRDGTDVLALTANGQVCLYASGTSGAGRVGIGTNAPNRGVHIWVSNAGTDPTWDAVDGILVEGASAIVQVFTATNGVGGIQFSDTTRAMGGILYAHTTDTLTLRAAGDNIRLSADGTGVKVTSGYSSGTVGALDAYDDAMVLHRGMSMGSAKALLDVGALVREPERGDIMWDLDRTIMLLGGGVYQTRALLDHMASRVKALEAEVAALRRSSSGKTLLTTSQ